MAFLYLQRLQQKRVRGTLQRDRRPVYGLAPALLKQLHRKAWEQKGRVEIAA